MIRMRSAGGGGVQDQVSGEEDSVAGAPSLAFDLVRAHSAKAEAYLEEQTKLTRLQIADLEREDKVRHWSLRVRHVSDVLKLGFELAAVAFVAIVVFFMLGAIWNATHDSSLVIDAFDVPPDLAQKGLSGKVIAGRIEDRLHTLAAETDSIRLQSSYRQSWGDDIKVQIPDTGVSVSEFYRTLVAWLGHEKHISGSVWHTPHGLALNTRFGDAPAITLTAPDERTDSLIVRAAESLYAQTEPYRHAVYLAEKNRESESTAALRDLALHGPQEERVWAYTMWGQNLLGEGNVADALEKSRIAAALNADLPNVMFNLAGAEEMAGDAEAALRDNRRALQLFQGPSAAQLSRYAVVSQISNAAREIDESLGDFRAATNRAREVAQRPNYNNSHLLAPIFEASYLASAHDLGAAMRADPNAALGEPDSLAVIATDSFNADTMPLPYLARAMSSGNWAVAQDDLRRLQASLRISSPVAKAFVPVLVRPLEAYADARLGQFGAAHALIDKTALDCYLCLRMRGDIDAVQRNWNGAASWFARAVRAAPSIPFAYADWGEMLLRKGDLDGAIAKFAIANQKGPHFADSLEMWGEALIAKSRSDLALAKFEEANKYAPNWGRLHLKWGEALTWAGKHDEAANQFGIARTLNLTAAEKSELARMGAFRGR